MRKEARPIPSPARKGGGGPFFSKKKRSLESLDGQEKGKKGADQALHTKGSAPGEGSVESASGAWKIKPLWVRL